jgi:hypothetical protein
VTLVIIFGPPAVGKMTVGLELERLTGDPQDRAFVEGAVQTFSSRGGRVCFVELEATQAERLRRNETPLRLSEKRPQRDVAGSRAFLLEADNIYEMNSRGPFAYADRYLRIDNTDLEPEVVARRIAAHFSLTAERPS